jgi:hypothetical protein
MSSGGVEPPSLPLKWFLGSIHGVGASWITLRRRVYCTPDLGYPCINQRTNSSNHSHPSSCGQEELDALGWNDPFAGKINERKVLGIRLPQILGRIRAAVSLIYCNSNLHRVGPTLELILHVPILTGHAPRSCSTMINPHGLTKPRTASKDEKVTREYRISPRIGSNHRPSM